MELCLPVFCLSDEWEFLINLFQIEILFQMSLINYVLMSQVYTSIIRPVIVNTFLLGSFDKPALRWEIFYDAQPLFIYLFICLLVYFFIYLFNICLFYWFYSTTKTGFRIFSNTFRSISSPIDNVFCSRCWLAKHFKTFSDKLLLIVQTFSERKTRLIGKHFWNFNVKTFQKRFWKEKRV